MVVEEVSGPNGGCGCGCQRRHRFDALHTDEQEAKDEDDEGPHVHGKVWHSQDHFGIIISPVRIAYTHRQKTWSRNWYVVPSMTALLTVLSGREDKVQARFRITCTSISTSKTYYNRC